MENFSAYLAAVSSSSSSSDNEEIPFNLYNINYDLVQIYREKWKREKEGGEREELRDR